jgi:aminomethyltransferase
MRRSPLHQLNERLGARFVDFGGWEMPLQYESVLAEHRAVRNSAGWFDVSHLGRFSWEGPGAQDAIDHLLTNDPHTLAPGGTQYTLMLNEDGGIVDDLLIWMWGEESFWVLPNAATHEEVMGRFHAAAPGVSLQDLREETAMVAVQGPEAPAVLEEVVGEKPTRFRAARLEGGLVLAGTGYTGERGGEIVGPPALAATVVEDLMSRGVVACGLGARDTLRLEAGLLLAGQDFDTTTHPFEAGLGFAVSMDHDFVGRDNIAGLAAAPGRRRLVAFTMPGRLIPRHGYPMRAGAATGRVTSGNFSPLLGQGIGLGYLETPGGELPSDPVEVEIRGRWEPATVVELPFRKHRPTGP